jgi:hypothetical protein
MNGRKLIPGRPLPASEIPDYDIRRDTLEETLSLAFRKRLERLNEFVLASGETPEGNIFYPDHESVDVARPPTLDLAPARRNFWRATRFKRRLLEVGVNAGHSALLALSCNAKLEYYGVDLNEHSYTALCVGFLQREFPGRVKFFAGDSRQVLPRLVEGRAEYAFDLIHVDGGHTSEVAFSDVSNAIALAKGLPGRHLLVDDVHASWIFDIVCEFLARGDLTGETMFGDWEDSGRNLLARIG